MVHTCNPSTLKGAEEVTQWLKARITGYYLHLTELLPNTAFLCMYVCYFLFI